LIGSYVILRLFFFSFLALYFSSLGRPPPTIPNLKIVSLHYGKFPRHLRPPRLQGRLCSPELVRPFPSLIPPELLLSFQSPQILSSLIHLPSSLSSRPRLLTYPRTLLHALGVEVGWLEQIPPIPLPNPSPPCFPGTSLFLALLISEIFFTLFRIICY